MTLEDFEKSLADDQIRRREKSDKDRGRRDPDRDRSKDRSKHHHRSSHHHRRHSSRSRERESRRDRGSRHHDDDGHRDKRSRHSTDHGDDREPSHKRRHTESSQEKGQTSTSKPDAQEESSRPKRDSWMEAPSALDVEYVHRPDPKQAESNKPTMLQADFELKIHEKELNSHLRDLKEGKALDDIEEEPSQHEVDYTFGDSGSQWRMTKLKGVYREAEDSGRPVEEVAVARFGDMRSFDDSREEEIELDRRKMYGKSYVGKEKPTGELFQERKLKEVRRGPSEYIQDPAEGLKTEVQGKRMEMEPPTNTTQPLDQTALNRLKAQMMKAKLRGASNTAELEENYNAALAAFSNRKEADVVVLGVKENRMLAGSRNEVKSVDTKRGRERGQVQDNEDMTIEDMVREERKTRGQFGREGHGLAERIARDGKFEVSSSGSLVVSSPFNTILE